VRRTTFALLLLVAEMGGEGLPGGSSVSRNEWGQVLVNALTGQVLGPANLAHNSF